MTEEVSPPSHSSFDDQHPAETTVLKSHDIVVLRSNRSLIGTVSQTYLDSDHESWEDPLIIAHAPVPSSVIHSFVTNGVPPKGYIFIAWAREEYGHSLVAERDVILLNRPFNIGDTVKTAADRMVGTVVNVSESYTLEPIARIINGALDFGQKDNIAPSGGLHFAEDLLYDIPGEELKRVTDFVEGDYVLRKDWIGLVEDTDLAAVLLLENNTLVIPRDTEDLELVIPDYGKPLITLPHLAGIKGPDVLAAYTGGMMSTPYNRLWRGQFVITSRKNIREGRWLVGEYHESCNPQGYVLDLRASQLEVQWLCPNAFAPESSAVAHRPYPMVRPYENLGTYNAPSELRRNKSVVLYDRLRQPRRTTPSEDPPIFPGHGTMRDHRVMFKDLAGAALKYQGGRHGKFSRIPKQSTFGFDLNEFRVVDCRQEVQIQWQDQRITRERSVTLTPYILPEAELCPGDIVTLKQGTKQAAIGSPDNTAVDFNEMLYFQGNFRLWSEKVGVVQSVDSKERLARLRLFANAKVELLEQGNVLRAGFRLGNISDVIEEVSLYEVMAHPALLRRRGDLVILPPERPSQDILRQLQANIGCSLLGPSTLSYLRSLRPTSKFEHLRNIAKHYVQSYGPLQHTLLPDGALRNAHDWVGEIMDLRTDGLATVRLGALGSECHDINIPFERILMVIDDDAELDDGSSLMSDVDPLPEYRSGSGDDDDNNYHGSESGLVEEVEYEGGKRLDDDSDSVWVTDDDVETEERDVVMEDSSSSDHVVNDEAIQPAGIEQDMAITDPRTNGPVDAFPGPSIRDLTRLRHMSEAPPSFSILDSVPPSDQFAVSETPPAFSAAFLRRVSREHRILTTSLPANEIYVRTYESRLDLLRCLIVGPTDTPYEHAPFLIDLQLDPEFPQVPPIAHFHSWTGGLGRINPNLYEEGKICLSLLNTWPGQSEGESWSEKANILQVLISLLGLVLVKEPFYNEAGFESYGEEKLYTRESQQYSEKAYVMARGFVKHALGNPITGLEDVLAYLYLPPNTPDAAESSNTTVKAHGDLLRVVIDRSDALMERSAALRRSDDILVDGAGQPGDSTKTFLRPLSLGAVVMLKKTISSLRRLLEEVNQPDPDD